YCASGTAGAVSFEGVVAGAAGWVGSGAGRLDWTLLASDASMVGAWRETPANAAMIIDKVMNSPPRTAVERVRKSAAPRAVMNPDELPPTPSPPPSDRCIRMTLMRATAIMVWTIRRKANMSGFRVREVAAT